MELTMLGHGHNLCVASNMHPLLPAFGTQASPIHEFQPRESLSCSPVQVTNGMVIS